MANYFSKTKPISLWFLGTMRPNINAFYTKYTPDTNGNVIWASTSEAETAIKSELGITDTSLIPLGLTILVNDSSDDNKQKEYWWYKDDNI